MDWITPLLMTLWEVCAQPHPCLKLPEVAPPEPPAIVQPVEEKTIQALPETKCVEVWKPEAGLICEKDPR